MTVERPGFSRLGYLLLALLALGWGCNWPIMKIVLTDVAPLTFRGVCLLAGGAGVLLLARIAGQSLVVPAGYRLRLLVLTAFSIVGWNVLVIYGVALLPSGRAALLGYTMPLWSMSLSLWLLGERLTPRRILALALGLIGVLVLMGIDLLRFNDALLGVGLMLAAAFTWGAGVVLLKRFSVPMPVFSFTGWMLLLGGLPIMLAAIALEHDSWRPLGFIPALGLVYNAIVAFMFCYWAWNRIVLMVPVAVSSLSSLLTPMVGVAGGVLLLNEELSWREVVAGLSILSAIWLVLHAPDAARTPAQR